MAQVFSRAADTYFRLFLIGVIVLLVGGMLLGGGLVRSDYLTRQRIAPEQPVPFSHRHHAGQLGIDCRYCHDSVERAATAGYPSTHTCMSCHYQLWTHANELAPVRESLATGKRRSAGPASTTCRISSISTTASTCSAASPARPAMVR